MKLKNKTHKKKIKDSKSKRERRKKTRKRMKGGAAAARIILGKVSNALVTSRKRRRDKATTIRKASKVGPKDDFGHARRVESESQEISKKYIGYPQISQNESTDLLTLYKVLVDCLSRFSSHSSHILDVNDINIYIKYKNGIVNKDNIIVMKTP